MMAVIVVVVAGVLGGVVSVFRAAWNLTQESIQLNR